MYITICVNTYVFMIGEQVQVFSEGSQSHMNRIPNLFLADPVARDKWSI